MLVRSRHWKPVLTSVSTCQPTTSSSGTSNYVFPHVPYTGPHSAQPVYSMAPPHVEASPTQSFHPSSTYSGRRFSHANTQIYGSSSPYAQAYARRTASYNTTPTLSVMRATGGMAATAEHWDQARRHSDGVNHPSQSSSTADVSSPK